MHPSSIYLLVLIDLTIFSLLAWPYFLHSASGFCTDYRGGDFQPRRMILASLLLVDGPAPRCSAQQARRQMILEAVYRQQLTITGVCTTRSDC
jgi:hypothetical protein